MLLNLLEMWWHIQKMREMEMEMERLCGLHHMGWNNMIS